MTHEVARKCQQDITDVIGHCCPDIDDDTQYNYTVDKLAALMR